MTTDFSLALNVGTKSFTITELNPTQRNLRGVTYVYELGNTFLINIRVISYFSIPEPSY